MAEIEKLIEERKKALRQMTPHHEPEIQNIERHVTPIEDLVRLRIEDRDNLAEYKSFERERNAELSKIMAERNKIIEDIKKMVNETDFVPSTFEQPVVEKLVAADKPEIEGKPIEKPVVEEKPIIEQKPEIEEDTHLQEDRSLEHKFQYEETELVHDNFDPIVTDQDVDLKDIDYTKNDILLPEDAEDLKKSKKSMIPGSKDGPKSFEDIFETKEEIEEKHEEVVESSITPETKVEEPVILPPPPVEKAPVMKEPVAQDYEQRAHVREEMYEKKSEKSRKKGYWIGGGIIAFVLLMIYLASNTGSFTPPEKNEQTNNEQTTTPPVTEQKDQQQQNEQQTPPSKENTPPVTTGQEQKTEKTPETTGETQKTQTPPPAQEEITFDKNLNVAFVNGPEGLFIQTASFKSKADAEKSASTVKAGDKKVSVVRADLGEKGIYFRVRVGTFASMDEARQFAGKLK